MPKVSAKRQITIPIDLCHEAKIEPGDKIEIFYLYAKKEKGAAVGAKNFSPLQHHTCVQKGMCTPDWAGEPEDMPETEERFD